ncbi:MAG: hypothetical protein D4R68_06200 [Ignavibacteriales bacterium]|nr:MAG: hypothetical protein D4R68_06200 [Ignavibacteriales bacterium]
MSRKKSFELNEDMINKIISVAYEDASLKNKFIVMRAAAQNPEIRAALYSYKQTAKEVDVLREEEYPDDLIRNVIRKSLPASKNRTSFLFDLYSTVFSRPIISAVTTIILITAIVTALIVNKPAQLNYHYSQTEINDADQQARKAFAIVGKFFKQTQTTLENEIMGERVAKPINNGIGIVNNLFEGETK